jgi:hypothetical protein
MYSLAVGVAADARAIVTAADAEPMFTTLMLNVAVIAPGTVYTVVSVFAAGAD